MAGKKFSELPPEKRAELGRKGGIRSGEVKREKNAKRRAMKETLEIVMRMPLDNSSENDINEIIDFAHVNGANLTVQDAIIIKAVREAMESANPRLLEFLRDTMGEKPTEKTNINMQLPVFFEGENELED